MSQNDTNKKAELDTDNVPDVIAQIKDHYPDLSPAEQSVADAVLSNVNAAVAASNAEIAQRANVSEPTVTRFCRSVGCAGVRDFKLRLARSLVVGELFLASDKPAEVPHDKTLPPFWNSILGEARLALRKVEAQLDPLAVQDAGALVANAGRVVVLGLGGSSGSLAEETQVRLFRFGVPIVAYKDPYHALMNVSTFGPKDVLIAISATGRTREALKCVELAKNYHGNSIAITRPGSALAKASDVSLTVDIPEYPDAITPSASRFGFLMAIDLLAAATGYGLGDQARENLRRIKYNLTEQGASGGLEPLGE